MEPITHMMTGACLARAGLNRRAAYTTLAMTLAAEAPDVDTLWSIKGPVAGFAHHRGITHTLVAAPLEACVAVAAIWCLHRFRVYRARSRQTPGPLTLAPVRWGWLWVFTLIALLSHLLLDFTNNYGLRPFFPFNPRWYAGSIVFIFEPLLFLALLGGLLLPSLFGLINAEVGERRRRFQGRGWAVAALLFMFSLWLWRFNEQQKAIRLASTLDFSSAQPVGTLAVPILRIFASPYPINPYRWHLVVEAPEFYQIAAADTLAGTIEPPTPADVFHKPQTTLATLAAKRSPLGEAYLDWASYPLVTETTATTQDPAAPDSHFTVSFRDLRFFYDVPLMPGRTHPPLTGTVTLDADRRVIDMEMNDRHEPPAP